MIKVAKACMIAIHSELQISNYMHLFEEALRLHFAAYSREELSKNFHWGAGEGAKGIQRWC